MVEQVAEPKRLDVAELYLNFNALEDLLKDLFVRATENLGAGVLIEWSRAQGKPINNYDPSVYCVTFAEGIGKTTEFSVALRIRGYKVEVGKLADAYGNRFNIKGTFTVWDALNPNAETVHFEFSTSQATQAVSEFLEELEKTAPKAKEH